MGDFEYSGDVDGWYSKAILNTNYRSGKIYSLKNFDGSYVVTVQDESTQKTIELELYELADIMRLFQITEKMRRKMGKGAACSRAKITNVKAVKSEVF